MMAMTEAVKQPRRKDEDRTQDEVGQLAHAACGGEHEVNQVLDEAYHHAVDRSQRKGRNQRGQLGKVQLDETGHQRHVEADKHQHRGHCAEHGGHGQFAHRQLAVGRDGVSSEGGNLLGHTRPLLRYEGI